MPGSRKHEDVGDDTECVQHTQLIYQSSEGHLQPELRLIFVYNPHSYRVTFDTTGLRLRNFISINRQILLPIMPTIPTEGNNIPSTIHLDLRT